MLEQSKGKQWKQCQTLFFWAPKSLQMVIAAMKLKDTNSLEGKLSLQQGCGVSGPGVWTEWGLWGHGELCGGLPLSWVGALGGGSEHWGPGGCTWSEFQPGHRALVSSAV